MNYHWKKIQETIVKNKINNAIKLLIENEPKNQIYHLAFSGGKDSLVCYHLLKMAGLSFDCVFVRTSVDPPELIKFIKQNYPETKFEKPSISMFSLILKKGMLPLRKARFCCEYLKEFSGKGKTVVTGVRKAESNFRSQYGPTSKHGGKKHVRPILDFTTNEVWYFIKSFNIPYCSLYDEGFERIGCIGCPMATVEKKRAGFDRYPGHKKAYINTIRKLMDIGKYSEFESAESVL